MRAHLRPWFLSGVQMVTVFSLPILVVIGIVLGVLAALVSWVLFCGVWTTLGVLLAWSEGVFDDE